MLFDEVVEMEKVLILVGKTVRVDTENLTVVPDANEQSASVRVEKSHQSLQPGPGNLVSRFVGLQVPAQGGLELAPSLLSSLNESLNLFLRSLTEFGAFSNLLELVPVLSGESDEGDKAHRQHCKKDVKE